MFTLEIIKAIVLGIVEGLTEWLPVSSTGHMILVDEFMSLNVSKAFMDMFLVVIQLGAILAVVALNFDRLNPFSKRKKICWLIMNISSSTRFKILLVAGQSWFWQC